MSTQHTESTVNTIQSLFNPQGSQGVIKTMASMNERMTAIFVEAGTRSVEIMSTTAKEALSNFAEATQVRDDPADYAKAYSDFAQKQMDLLARTAQDVGEVTQKAGSETKGLASDAGEEMSEKVAENAQDAADKVTASAKDVVEKGAEKTKDAADKASWAAKKAN